MAGDGSRIGVLGSLSLTTKVGAWAFPERYVPRMGVEGKASWASKAQAEAVNPLKSAWPLPGDARQRDLLGLVLAKIAVPARRRGRGRRNSLRR